jgi:hypothetical protein
VDNARLAESTDAAAEIERAVRYHLASTQGNVAEQARGQVAYRHAVALRKSLEEWIVTRAFIAQESEDASRTARIG